jgi:hypothetical protein
LVPGSTVVNRETVEAAVWQTLGWHCDPVFVSRLMHVIDAYTDSRCRRAVTQWAGTPQAPLPAAGISLAQSAAVRRQLQLISSMPSAPLAAAVVSARRQSGAVLPAVVSQVPAEALGDVVAALAVPVGQLETEPPDGARDEQGFLIAQLFSCSGPCKKTDLPRDAFWRNTKRPSGVDYQCKECKRRRMREYRQGLKNAAAARSAPASAGD